VAEIARATGTAILGPNCMGLIDLTTGCATYIDEIHPFIRRGGVAAIAQSGSVADAFMHAGTRIGWSRIVSCGSEVVLDLCDYLAYCLDDPSTDAVVLFVEGFKRPERFLALADQALAMGKPILAVKVGRSAQAQAAAVAHTGSLAGEDRVTRAALRAAGVIRCDDLDELLEAAALVTGAHRLGRRVGRGRTAVVTVSTGEGSLIADLATRTGIDLPDVPDAARARIAAALPSLGYIGNPMDPWGADEATPAYRTCFEAFTSSGAYDVLALVHDFPFRSQAGELSLALELAGELATATAGHPDVLPVFVSLTSGDASPELQEALDAAGGIPIVRGTVPAFAAIARLAWWEARHERRLVDEASRAAWPALAADRTPYGYDDSIAALEPAAPSVKALPERESVEALGALGLPVVALRAIPLVDDSAGALGAAADAAADAASAMGWPAVVKLDALDLAHKSDVGAVVLGLREAEAVREAVATVVGAGGRAGTTIRGVLVQAMAAEGTEVIVGARRDPQFGVVVLVGLGGVLAEVLDDVVIRLAPLTPTEALEMIDELRGAPVLRGIRGRPAADLAALAQLISDLGRAMVEHPAWREVDLNPVIAGPAGALAVDALIVVDAPHP
jgi:acyl-CoA synthetase (NDP forming)